MNMNMSEASSLSFLLSLLFLVIYTPADGGMDLKSIKTLSKKKWCVVQCSEWTNTRRKVVFVNMNTNIINTITMYLWTQLSIFKLIDWFCQMVVSRTCTVCRSGMPLYTDICGTACLPLLVLLLVELTVLAVEALVVPVEFVVEVLVPVVLLALEAGVLCSPSIVPPRCLTFEPRPPRCHTRRKLRETENKNLKIPVAKIFFHRTMMVSEENTTVSSW